MSDKTTRNMIGEERRQLSGGLFFSEEAVEVSAFADQLQNGQVSALTQKAYRGEIPSGFRDRWSATPM